MSDNKNSNIMLKSLFMCREAVIFYSVIFLFAILAIITRVSIVNEVDDYTAIDELIIESVVSDSSIKTGAADCEKNLKSAEYVITAVFTGERSSAHYATLSTMKVTGVIKGDMDILGSNIKVYENNALSASKSRIYLRNFTPVNFFTEDREYLLFLNKYSDFDDEYAKYKNVFNNTYIMADYFASSFCIDETESEVLNHGTDPITVDYGDFKSSEFIVFSQEQRETMYSLKSKVIYDYL